MRLPRMTTRRWMIAVGISALVIGGTVLSARLTRRHDHFVSRAQDHAWKEAMADAWAKRVRAYWEGRGGIRGQARLETLVARVPLVKAYHGALARKYRHAARYPWLPVAPDPPELSWPEDWPARSSTAEE